MTNKERLIKHLKFWAAEGFRLKPDATHMTAYGKPIYTDMKKIEGGDLKCWSMRDSAWFVQVPSRIAQWCLPLSLLTDDELAEFTETPAQDNGTHEDPTPALTPHEASKERLIKRLRDWSAKGFRLHPEATHMYPTGEPILSDMKMIVDEQVRCLSGLDGGWYAQRCVAPLPLYLPLSMLSDEELSEFREAPAQEKTMSTDKERLRARDATHLHLFTRGAPVSTDMKKIEGDNVSYWSRHIKTWAKETIFDDELAEFTEPPAQEKAMSTDKEQLLAHLKKWSAKGYKLRRDATHMDPRGTPALTDMKKVEGDAISLWSRQVDAWLDETIFSSPALERYLPLSLLSEEELSEFTETPAQEKYMRDNKEKLLAYLKKWSAKGFKLQPDATHVFASRRPAPTDIKKIEGDMVSCWPRKGDAWVEQMRTNSSFMLKHYLPLSLLSEEELSEFTEAHTQEKAMKTMSTDKETLLHHLRKWSAKGFRLRPGATHMYTRGEPVLMDMKKFEGNATSYWSQPLDRWNKQMSLESAVALPHYLPLSLLSDEELAEFREPSAHDNDEMIAADGPAAAQLVAAVKPAALPAFPASAYNADTTQPHHLGGFFG